MADRRSPAGRGPIAVLAVAALLLLAGCGSEAPDPEAERLDRVEQRLTSSFSPAQASCILDALDAPTIVALDEDRALPAEGPALTGYTEALQGCVTDGAPTTVPATTTAPSTTAGG